MGFRKIRFSSIAIALCMLWCIATITNYATYRVNGHWGPFKHDQFCYYVYLPAVFVHGGDLDFKFTETLEENTPNQFFPVTAPLTGKKVNKVTIGMSILFAPAFLIAHGITLAFPDLSNVPASGFSQPYRIAMNLNTLLLMFLSLLMLRRILQRYFDDMVVGFTLIGTLLGTNLFYYAVHEHMMSHAYSFFLFTLVMWLTLRWHDTSKGKFIIALGALSGLIVLIRPTNILILVLFLLYGVQSVSDFKEKVQRLYAQKGAVLTGTALGLLVVFPQLLYWKMQAGQWIFFSYDSDERFFWTEPAIYKGLFSYCKGWYVYTPLMFFATLGIWGLRKAAPAWFLPITVFFVLNVYVVLSWWSWWYGGGFGLRAFVDCVGVMSLGLAAFIAWIFRQNRYLLPFLFFLFGFSVFLNIFQTMQYKKTLIRWNGMTGERYWRVFMRPEVHECERDEIFEIFEEPSR
jgi:hypothetical protein